MATSAQIRQKITEIVTKRSKNDQDIGAAERKKAAKEAEAADKTARAAKSNAAGTVRSYLRAAEMAQNAAIGRLAQDHHPSAHRRMASGS